MIYVYLKQCVQVAKNSAVRLGDVAQVVALGGGVKEARAVVLGRLEDSPFLLTAADVVFALGREDVTMLGAPACAVVPLQAADKPALHWFKAAVVCALLFVGGGMTVLAYQTDTAMLDAHAAIAQTVTGDEQDAPWVSLPYCAGVGLGVLLFSNVLPGKKKKPSVFEIEQFEKQDQERRYLADQAEGEK